ncbi:hypothetical protein PUR29_30980 [Methylobacterium ajmalii]|uniref:Uncharacterized protein n=1 Tax=Methylobacterium ajmalii TaxID=2738439 RepID=A0ABU9ZTB3_9HYPH
MSEKTTLLPGGYYLFQRRLDDMTCSLHMPDGLHIGNLRSEYAGDFTEVMRSVMAPEGYALVPRELTEGMLDAAVKGSCADVSYADVEELWPVLLDAALGAEPQSTS